MQLRFLWVLFFHSLILLWIFKRVWDSLLTHKDVWDDYMWHWHQFKKFAKPHGHLAILSFCSEYSWMSGEKGLLNETSSVCNRSVKTGGKGGKRTLSAPLHYWTDWRKARSEFGRKPYDAHVLIRQEFPISTPPKICFFMLLISPSVQFTCICSSFISDGHGGNHSSLGLPGSGHLNYSLGRVEFVSRRNVWEMKQTRAQRIINP